MTHVSLFSGIDGIGIAAEWAGFTTVAQVERDPFCLKVLERHWPRVHRCHDIRDFPDREFSPVTLVSGGPPCQPASLAGKRRGAEDDRWLWPEALRVVGELKPRWVCLENPPGIIGLGLSDILSTLEGLGYDFPRHLDGAPIVPCIPVAAVGAPHIRQRVFILAYRTSSRCSERRGEEGGEVRHEAWRPESQRLDGSEIHTDTEGVGRGTGRPGRVATRDEGCGRPEGVSPDSEGVTEREPTNETDPIAEGWQARPESGGCRWWETQPSVDPLVHGLPRGLARVALRLVGNSVSPYQVYPILAAIAECEQ